MSFRFLLCMICFSVGVLFCDDKKKTKYVYNHVHRTRNLPHCFDNLFEKPSKPMTRKDPLKNRRIKKPDSTPISTPVSTPHRRNRKRPPPPPHQQQSNSLAQHCYETFYTQKDCDESLSVSPLSLRAPDQHDNVNAAATQRSFPIRAQVLICVNPIYMPFNIHIIIQVLYFLAYFICRFLKPQVKYVLYIQHKTIIIILMYIPFHCGII